MGKLYNAELFAERLLELMKESGDTTYSLAEYLDMAPSTISKYTTGVSAPKTAILEKISIRYNVNPVWLMGCETVDKQLPLQKIEQHKKIPVVGVIAAGRPIIADEFIIGYEYIQPTMHADFCLKIKGDSMINARIYNDDIVYIRQQPDVENGEIAAVLIDDEATLKRVYKSGNTIILRPENPTYKDIIINKKDYKQIKIIGKCIAAKIWLE